MSRAVWSRVVRWPSRFCSQLLIGMVRVYQLCISPLLGRNCRFEPTCSAYFILAVRKYGPLSGAMRGLGRIARCHPFYRGNFYDPP
jgi:hypothetical protein